MTHGPHDNIPKESFYFLEGNARMEFHNTWAEVRGGTFSQNRSGPEQKFKAAQNQ